MGDNSFTHQGGAHPALLHRVAMPVTTTALSSDATIPRDAFLRYRRGNATALDRVDPRSVMAFACTVTYCTAASIAVAVAALLIVFHTKAKARRGALEMIAKRVQDSSGRLQFVRGEVSLSSGRSNPKKPTYWRGTEPWPRCCTEHLGFCMRAAQFVADISRDMDRRVRQSRARTEAHPRGRYLRPVPRRFVQWRDPFLLDSAADRGTLSAFFLRGL